jgi:hypothetical protein
MGQPGDLLLVFADALTRSWKQIIKFRSSTSSASAGEVDRRSGEGARGAGEGSGHGIGGFISATAPVPAGEVARSAGEGRTFAAAYAARPAAGPRDPGPVEPSFAGEIARDLRGLIRDERGVRLAPEAED